MLASSSGSQVGRSTASGRHDLPAGNAAPIEALSAPALPVADVRFMQGITSTAAAAVSGMAVQSKEPIVVQF